MCFSAGAKLYKVSTAFDAMQVDEVTAQIPSAESITSVVAVYDVENTSAASQDFESVIADTQMPPLENLAAAGYSPNLNTFDDATRTYTSDMTAVLRVTTDKNVYDISSPGSGS